MILIEYGNLKGSTATPLCAIDGPSGMQLNKLRQSRTAALSTQSWRPFLPWHCTIDNRTKDIVCIVHLHGIKYAGCTYTTFIPYSLFIIIIQGISGKQRDTYHRKSNKVPLIQLIPFSTYHLRNVSNGLYHLSPLRAYRVQIP